jgi:hypothetical protein
MTRRQPSTAHPTTPSDTAAPPRPHHLHTANQKCKHTETARVTCLATGSHTPQVRRPWTCWPSTAHVDQGGAVRAAAFLPWMCTQAHTHTIHSRSHNCAVAARHRRDADDSAGVCPSPAAPPRVGVDFQTEGLCLGAVADTRRCGLTSVTLSWPRDCNCGFERKQRFATRHKSSFESKWATPSACPRGCIARARSD